MEWNRRRAVISTIAMHYPDTDQLLKSPLHSLRPTAILSLSRPSFLNGRANKSGEIAPWTDVEKRVIGKVMWRLIPFLIVCYFVAYLDRVNVGFAKLHMNQALGLSEAAFGLGAGLFFVGYFIFEVPSNIFLEKVGARLWIARIMITWGIVSAAFAFIPSISASTGLPSTGLFYFLRLLLGACEAGFFPGIIFYLTLWFPAVYRARVISLFMLAIPISSIIGSPISGPAAGPERLGTGRLAVAVHSRSVAVRSGRHRRAGLSDRFPAPGELAATGRDRLAGERAGHREGKQGKGRTPLARYRR